MKNLLLVSLGLISLYVSRTLSTLDALDYKLVGFKIHSIEPLSIYSTISFKIFNPSPSALRFSEFEGTIYYNRKRISTAHKKAVSLIPAMSGKVIHLDAPIHIQPSLQVIAEILQHRGVKPFRIIGSIKLNGIKYPIDQEISPSYGR